MAKGQRHIDNAGNIGVCRRTTGVCPFEERGHYDSREDAENAYGAMQDNSSVPESSKKQVLAKSPKTVGFSVEDGGYYGVMPPRTIQIEALNATADALIEDGSTQLVAACGTGKSYMGRQLMRRMMDEEGANGVAIVLTSSRKLVTDTAKDLRPDDNNGHYDQAIGAYGQDYEVEVIEIHSDSKDDIKENGAVSPQKIAERWSAALNAGKRVVIVSTYQSSDKVQQVQALIGARAEADLLMNDEAHNVLGQKKSVTSDEDGENSGYRSFVNEIPGSIQAKHRLYATATPPLADSPDDDETSAKGESREEQIASMQEQVERMGKNGRERLTVYSDDQHVLGKVSGAITQQEAIDNGYLTRPEYQLRAAVVKGNPSLSEGGYVNTRGEYVPSVKSEEGPRTMTAQTYSAVSATLQAMTSDSEVDTEGKIKNPVHNALAYTGSIEQARAFRDNFKAVALEQSGNMELATAEKSINSSDEDLRRKARLRLLAEHGEAVAAYSGETQEARKERNKAFSMFEGKSFTKEDSERGWNPHKKVLANVDIFSEGISINEIDTVVISDQSKTSERAMTQAIGRSLRTVRGNEFKSTGHVIIPQVVDENGKELNGGFVTAASYGATRVERAVSTMKLKGQSVPADESTFVSRYDSNGKARDRKLAASIAKTHVSSPDDLIASQVIERADSSLRSIAKGASPVRRGEAEAYRKSSKAEQAQMQRSFIAAQASNPKVKDISWGVAHRALRDVNGSDMAAVRQSGRVITSALSAGDFSAVPKPVAEKLSHAGIIRKRTGAGNAGPTIQEKRELVLGSAESVVTAFALKGGQEAHPDIAAYLSQGVDLKAANQYAVNPKRGSAEDFGRLVSNYKTLAENHDTAADRIYKSIETAKNDNKPAPGSLSSVLSQKGGISKDNLWSGLSDLKSKVADRNAKAAAGGSADYELDPSMVSKNGLLKAEAQKKLAEII